MAERSSTSDVSFGIVFSSLTIVLLWVVSLTEIVASLAAGRSGVADSVDGFYLLVVMSFSAGRSTSFARNSIVWKWELALAWLMTGFALAAAVGIWFSPGPIRCFSWHLPAMSSYVILVPFIIHMIWRLRVLVRPAARDQPDESRSRHLSNS